MENDINIKKEAVKVLVESDVFKKHPSLIELLEYLFDKNQKGEHIKSISIAVDLLNNTKASKSTDRDAVIRTRIFNLRKKIELFYLTEGRNEKYKLNIPKGSYELKLINSVAVNKKPNYSFNSKTTILLLLGLIISLCFTIAFLIFKPKPQIDIYKNIHKHVLLEGFFKKKQHINVIVGEKEIYGEFDDVLKRYRFIFEINHIEDKDWHLEEQKKLTPKRLIINPEYYHSDVETLTFGLKLNNSLIYHGLNASFHTSSKIKTIKKDYIFLGGILNNDMKSAETEFKYLSKNTNIVFFSKKNHFRISFKDRPEILMYTWVPQHIVSYFYIRKKKIGENQMLFLLGSKPSARNYMNERLFTEKFSNEIQTLFNNKVPNEYEILYSIEGINSDGFTHKVVYAGELKKEPTPYIKEKK